jgi:hypothetical protein
VFEDETPVAWQAMPRHAAVVAGDGSEIGVAERWLGDQGEDIFHGIVVRRHDGEAIEVPARRIKRMTEQHVVTDLAVDEAEALPAYKDR